MTVQQQIDQLNALKKQALVWRTVGTLALLVIALWSVNSLYQSANGLVAAGPRQEELFNTVKSAVNDEVVPKVQNLATQTLTEVRADLMKEAEKINQRVPELSDAFVKELETLQTNLPTTGEKILTEKFQAILTDRESKIREMYPNVTPEQVTTLVKNLVDSGKAEILEANMEIFGPHQTHLKNIIVGINKIKATEKVGADTPNWQFGLDVLDVLRDDLRKLNPEAPKKAAKAVAPAKKEATK